MPLDGEFVAYLELQGTHQKLAVHDTHEENGVSERVNRILLEKVRALLIASGLPKFLWAEALIHAVWLKNRTSTKALNGRTPYEAVYNEVPDLHDLPEWGCHVWVHDTSSGKLGVRAKAGRWVGFDQASKGHRVYWPDKRSVTVEREVHFSEQKMAAVDEEAVVLEGEEAAGGEPDSEPEPPPAPRAVRIRKPTQYVKDIRDGTATTHALPSRKGLPPGLQAPPPDEEAVPKVAEDKGELEEEIDGAAMAAEMSDAHGLEPRSLAEAKKSPAWPQWLEAIDYERRALEAHKTWRLEKPPPGANIVGCRWVFAIKRDAAGAITRYRARLVAQGFSQVPGVDFFDTFAPVAKMASIRTILAFAARMDCEIHQVDVKSA